MKLCWLIRDDLGGGVATVAESYCQQAARAGHQVTLLMLLPPSGRIAATWFQIASLGLSGSFGQAPQALLLWLEQHPQDVLFWNACEEADAAIPYLPSNLKCAYNVHDTAPRYWKTAVAEEDNLDAIAVVSQTVARKFFHLLKQPAKLEVLLNGCTFPELPDLNCSRSDDLLFLGGDNPFKGAYDIPKLWRRLVKLGFGGSLHWFGRVEPQLQAKIRRLPAVERIHLYGQVKRDVIFAKAASAKVLLVLTRSEAFGMATIEAMSMGCIPVAWDIPTGTKEIATANQTGLFAPLGNIDALARQVLYTCQHYSEFNSAVVERARANFDETLAWNRCAKLLDRLNQLPPNHHRQQGTSPIAYHPPTRRFQLLPVPIRSRIREFVGRSPYLSYWLSDFRGL